MAGLARLRRRACRPGGSSCVGRPGRAGRTRRSPCGRPAWGCCRVPSIVFEYAKRVPSGDQDGADGSPSDRLSSSGRRYVSASIVVTPALAFSGSAAATAGSQSFSSALEPDDVRDLSRRALERRLRRRRGEERRQPGQQREPSSLHIPTLLPHARARNASSERLAGWTGIRYGRQERMEPHAIHRVGRR